VAPGDDEHCSLDHLSLDKYRLQTSTGNHFRVICCDLQMNSLAISEGDNVGDAFTLGKGQAVTGQCRFDPATARHSLPQFLTSVHSVHPHLLSQLSTGPLVPTPSPPYLGRDGTVSFSTVHPNHPPPSPPTYRPVPQHPVPLTHHHPRVVVKSERFG
jgi:hypothetical protein